MLFAYTLLLLTTHVLGWSAVSRKHWAEQLCANSSTTLLFSLTTPFITLLLLLLLLHTTAGVVFCGHHELHFFLPLGFTPHLLVFHIQAGGSTALNRLFPVRIELSIRR